MATTHTSWDVGNYSSHFVFDESQIFAQFFRKDDASKGFSFQWKMLHQRGVYAVMEQFKGGRYGKTAILDFGKGSNEVGLGAMVNAIGNSLRIDHDADVAAQDAAFSVELATRRAAERKPPFELEGLAEMVKQAIQEPVPGIDIFTKPGKPVSVRISSNAVQNLRAQHAVNLWKLLGGERFVAAWGSGLIAGISLAPHASYLRKLIAGHYGLRKLPSAQHRRYDIPIPIPSSVVKNRVYVSGEALDVAGFYAQGSHALAVMAKGSEEALVTFYGPHPGPESQLKREKVIIPLRANMFQVQQFPQGYSFWPEEADVEREELLRLGIGLAPWTTARYLTFLNGNGAYVVASCSLSRSARGDLAQYSVPLFGAGNRQMGKKELVNFLVEFSCVQGYDPDEKVLRRSLMENLS